MSNRNTEQPFCQTPVIASTAIVVDLDSLANVCGFFNSETPVNNHYGCNHEDCGETELVRVNKKGEGMKERKLIWINDFKKTGYTAPARKLAHENN